MKKILKVWMYLCTFLFSAHILIVGALVVWTQFQSDEAVYITSSGQEIDLQYAGATAPDILKLFSAVENNNLEKIYSYAAPEPKEKVSYELFARDQWPNVSIEDIQVLFEETASLFTLNTISPTFNLLAARSAAPLGITALTVN